MATVQFAGPFKIYANPFRIKAEGRKPILTGELVTPVAVQVSGSPDQVGISRAVDGSGLADKNSDGLLEHSSKPADMWLTEKGQTTGSIEFDLGKAHKLDLIQIWNFNEKWHTNRGIKKADISIWTESKGWQRVFDDFQVDEADGSDDYDEPALAKLGGVQVQKIRFDDLANLGDAEYVGLSEVRFSEAHGPAAVRPQPADEAKGVGVAGLALQWIPGLDAVAHKVYLGTDPDKLELLGQVKDASAAKLSGLASDTKYYWRVDEIQADGSATKSKVWSFRTGGLLAWWKFDEAAGSGASDSSGNNLVGTIMGNPQWQPSGGKVGGALAFDGTDDYVDCGTEPSLNVTGEVTISAWIKLAERGIDQKIAGNDDNTTGGYKMGVFTNDKVEFEIKTATNRPYTNRNIEGGTVLTQGVWYHVAGVYSQGNYIRTYVNGELDRELTTQAAILGRSSGPFRIACETFNPRQYNFGGLIDDVRVYNCALSKADVGALHAGKVLPATVAKVTLEIPEKPQEKVRKLVAWWKLDVTDGNNVADSSGSNIAGTLVGDPQWRPAGGKVGGALAFDGEGDYVQIGNESAFDFTDQLTVAAWIKADMLDKEWQAIVTKGDSAWRLHREGNTNYLDFACTGISGDAVAVDAEPKDISDGSWHHVTAVYDGAKICLYVDGRLNMSGEASGTINTNDYPVLIGENAEQTGRGWKGLIDDVSIYNYALSDEEVAALYSGKEPVVVAGVTLPAAPAVGKNWMPVLIIVVIAGVVVAFATLRKKGPA